MPDVAFAADDRRAATAPTPFTSSHPPAVSLTVPEGWYVRSDVLDGMVVPWGLAFVSSEYVPWTSDAAGEWDDLVASSLSRNGAAVAVIALDRLEPASAWLVGGATSTLERANVDVGPSSPIGRPLSRGVAFRDLGTTVIESDNSATPYIGWYDQDHYLVGVQAWLGLDVPSAVVDGVLATIRA